MEKFKHIDQAIHYIHEMSAKLIQGGDLEDYYEHSIIPAIHEAFPDILKCAHYEWTVIYGHPNDEDEFFDCYAKCKRCGCMGAIEGVTMPISTHFMKEEGGMARGCNSMMYVRWTNLPSAPVTDT